MNASVRCWLFDWAGQMPAYDPSPPQPTEPLRFALHLPKLPNLDFDLGTSGRRWVYDDPKGSGSVLVRGDSAFAHRPHTLISGSTGQLPSESAVEQR